MTITLRPSDIYSTTKGKEALFKLLQDNEYRIGDFRIPKVGDVFIGAAGTIVRCTTEWLDKGSPRLILTKKTPALPPSYIGPWKNENPKMLPDAVFPGDIYTEETPETLQAYLIRTGYKVVCFTEVTSAIPQESYILPRFFNELHGYKFMSSPEKREGGYLGSWRLVLEPWSPPSDNVDPKGIWE